MKPEETKKFSLHKRVKSTNHGLRGIGVMFRHGHNAWLFIFFALVPLYLGFKLCISTTEWLVLILTFIVVMALEAVNTAMEIHMDLTSPDEHPHARDTKDVAAGAVLIAVFFGGIIGMIIFIPKVLSLFS
ncbi:MAG: diacylglycerol kinase family protein [Candidatus Pacebacteria bacterium]|nr:diacylglycerol kinase family protein [Candidatus Paceibacterota bacterium]